MLLKSLEIQGFKSFPDKTKITFNKGLTAVVGPNGSGKSNISDAIRWVMGEQSTKTLRGGRMEDVVFSGTASRKAQGWAMVSLSFDNGDRALAVDSDEVTITRRYYRSGESEYLVNGAAVRLKDINELFMDTGLGRDGYAMIGQGRIAEIVGAKGKERREIFEEAAGISKFRYRRTEAERKLEGAQENLLRLYDILNELEGRVGPLQAQSEKAAAFLKLSEEKKALEVSLWLKTLEQYRSALKGQENRWLIAKGEEERLAAAAEKLETEIAAAYDRRNGWAAKSDEYRRIRENVQARLAGLKADAAVRENELGHTLEGIREAEEALKRQEESSKEADRQIAVWEDKAQGIRGALAALGDERAALRENQQALARQDKDAGERLTALTGRAQQIELDISRHNMAIAGLQGGMADEQLRLSQAGEELLAVEKQAADEAEALAELDGLLSEIAGRRDTLQNALAGYEMKLAGRQNRLDGLRERQQELALQQQEKLQRAKLLLDLEENLEGFAQSVRAVMRWKKNGSLAGVHGTVASLLTVEEPYTLAIETALGGALQNLVVEDEGTAKSCIRRLQQERAGRATFLPLTSIKGNMLQEQGLAGCPGYLGLGPELVKCDPRYEGVVRFLLGRIVIAEDLDAAGEIARRFGYRFRVVSLDGQQVNAGGSFTGGSAARERGLLSRKNEAERLLQEGRALDGQKSALAAEADGLSAEIGRLKAEMKGVQDELATAGEDSIRFEGEKKRYLLSQPQLAKRRQQLAAQQADSAKRIADGKEKAAAAKVSLEGLAKEQAEVHGELARQQGQGDAFAKEREALLAALSDCSVREMGLQKDLDAALQNAKALREQKSSDKGAAAAQLKKKEELETKAKELQLARERMAGEEAAFSRQIEEYGERILQSGERQTEAEGEATKLRQQAGELSAQKERAAGELARLSEQKLAAQKDYDGIIQKLWEEYELTRSEAAAIALEIPDPAAAARELAGLKNQIKALGNVNLSAIEEYKEVSERYRFLKAQVDDAANARDELLGLIDGLTGEMERIFKESFTSVNRHFGEIFQQLFDGGSASLQLDDPNDVLNCGIEIFVQPPGKIIKNLAALSGGEQAFVAIAIYFAILAVRPAPFCVLDEIEAALDDVNVARYAAYLKGLCSRTQFILITHRRGTMEEADVLYGVTMQEQGVSKLLELKVAELSAGLMAGQADS